MGSALRMSLIPARYGLCCVTGWVSSESLAALWQSRIGYRALGRGNVWTSVPSR